MHRSKPIRIARILWSALIFVSPPVWCNVHAELAELREVEHIPVLAYALFENDAWQTNVVGAPRDVPLRWGSITKSATALLVHRLAAQNLVMLDTQLSRYVSSKHWQNPWRARYPITVRQLLELKAGLPDLSALEFDYNQPLSLRDALALNPAHRTARWPPGLQHVYSNMSAGLTQLLIETVSKQSYPEALRRHVLAPLAMDSASVLPVADLPGGFKADGQTPIPYWHMTFPAYGALNATLEDLTKLVAALRREANTLTRPAAGLLNGEAFAFDYASGVYPRVRAGRVWYSHGGDADGYRSRYAFLAHHPRAYVANINVDNPAALRAVERILEHHLTQDLPPPAAPAEFAVEAADQARMTGRYYPSGARFGLQRWADQHSSHAKITSRADGGLTFIKNRRRTVLIPVSRGQYRRTGDPVATIALTTIRLPDEPVRILQGELGVYIHAEDCNAHLASFFPPCKQP